MRKQYEPGRFSSHGLESRLVCHLKSVSSALKSIRNLICIANTLNPTQILKSVPWVQRCTLKITSNIYTCMHTVIDCGTPTVPQNGHTKYGSTIFNSLVMYSCDSCSTLMGVSISVCDRNGHWNPDAPYCQSESSRREYHVLGFCHTLPLIYSC